MEVSTPHIVQGNANSIQTMCLIDPSNLDRQVKFEGKGIYAFKQKTVLVVEKPDVPGAKDTGAAGPFFAAYIYRVPLEETILNSLVQPSDEFPIRCDFRKE